MNVKVSIIIPCYNQGKYIEETIGSVLASDFVDYEIIIVNDGSTDIETNEIFSKLSKPKTKIIQTQNQGLAKARNTAIANSTGKYILPLDSDDLISPSYLTEAVSILEKADDVKIVYCEAEYFGAKKGKWELPEFSIERLLEGNIIFCTALYRRSDFDKTYGYSTMKYMGVEDWNLWLSILSTGGDVYRIPKVHFYYRIINNSMIRSLTDSQFEELYNEIFKTHHALYAKYFDNPALLKQKLFKATAYKDNFLKLSKSLEYKLGYYLLRPFKLCCKTHKQITNNA